MAYFSHWMAYFSHWMAYFSYWMASLSFQVFEFVKCMCGYITIGMTAVATFKESVSPTFD